MARAIKPQSHLNMYLCMIVFQPNLSHTLETIHGMKQNFWTKFFLDLELNQNKSADTAAAAATAAAVTRSVSSSLLSYCSLKLTLG
jgi:hypothetical protein